MVITMGNTMVIIMVITVMKFSINDTKCWVKIEKSFMEISYF